MLRQNLRLHTANGEQGADRMIAVHSAHKYASYATTVSANCPHFSGLNNKWLSWGLKHLTWTSVAKSTPEEKKQAGKIIDIIFEKN